MNSFFFKGCPYFRTTENLIHCKILSHDDAKAIKIEEDRYFSKENVERRLLNSFITSLIIIIIAFSTVCSFCLAFYQRSKKGTKGRFDPISINYDSIKYEAPKTTKINVSDSENKPFIEKLTAETSFISN